MAWRQAHDAPQHSMGVDGPFSFCSYPFLLNPRAKSKLLHTEARFLMTQVSPCHLSYNTDVSMPRGVIIFISEHCHEHVVQRREQPRWHFLTLCLL